MPSRQASFPHVDNSGAATVGAPLRELNFSLYDVPRHAASLPRRDPPVRLSGRPLPLPATTASPMIEQEGFGLGRAPITTAPPKHTPHATLPSRRRERSASSADHASSKVAVTRLGRAGAAPVVPRPATLAVLQDEMSGAPDDLVASVGCSTAVASHLEERLRCLLQPVAAPCVLIVPLQSILAEVLRRFQHHRAQLKGLRPCHRLSRPNNGSAGGGLDEEVTTCLLDAMQAPSVMAAARTLADFLQTHSIDVGATTSVSPVVLVGAALADLIVSGYVVTNLVPPSLWLSLLDAAIDCGHAGAMQSVAACLRDGKGGVAQDVAASLTWLRCAAAAGYLPAMHELGETYERGVAAHAPAHANEEELSLEADWGEALQWYRQAAESGYLLSQLNLGKLLLGAAEQARQSGVADATEVAHLLAEAKRWLHACAATGVEEAIRLAKRLDDTERQP